MPRFRTLCPVCSNMNLITWHHVGCPSYYQEYIDINGYVTCDCGVRFHILDGRYNCSSNFHGNSFDPVTSSIRLRKILSMCTKLDGYNDCWLDALQTNIIREFDRRTYNKTYYY